MIHYFPLQNWSKAFHLASCKHREREKGEGEKELKGDKKWWGTRDKISIRFQSAWVFLNIVYVWLWNLETCTFWSDYYPIHRKYIHLAIPKRTYIISYNYICCFILKESWWPCNNFECMNQTLKEIIVSVNYFYVLWSLIILFSKDVSF